MKKEKKIEKEKAVKAFLVQYDLIVKQIASWYDGWVLNRKQQEIEYRNLLDKRDEKRKKRKLGGKVNTIPFK